jgi:hypothetical protein
MLKAAEAFSQLGVRMRDMEQKMTPPLFTYDRNGLRLGIAAIEDETAELWTAWDDARVKPDQLSDTGRADIQWELLDIAAIAMICFMQSLKDGSEVDGSTGQDREEEDRQTAVS